MAAGAVAQIIELLGEPRGIPIRMTIGNATAVPKGTLMYVTDPRTVAATGAITNGFIGIAAEEHVASVGVTNMTVYTKGIFSIEAGAAIAVGARVGTGAEANKVITVDSTELLHGVVGTALEAAAGDAEPIAVLVGGYY